MAIGASTLFFIVASMDARLKKSTATKCPHQDDVLIGAEGTARRLQHRRGHREVPRLSRRVSDLITIAAGAVGNDHNVVACSTPKGANIRVMSCRVEALQCRHVKPMLAAASLEECTPRVAGIVNNNGRQLSARTNIGGLAGGVQVCGRSVGAAPQRGGGADGAAVAPQPQLDLVHQRDGQVAPGAERLLHVPAVQRALVHRDAGQRRVL